MSDRIITPIAAAHPTRKPYVRDTTFMDGKPGPPFAFFDETQEHLGAAVHARLGWRWSVSREDFDRRSYPAGYLGALRIKKNQADPAGLRFALASALSVPGECGVWAGLVAHTTGNPFDVELGDVACASGADYLVSAKVALLGRSRLDIYTDEGFHLGVSPKAVGGAAFVAGGSSDTWWTFHGDRSPKYLNTGIPCIEGAYYVLQIGRVAGAIRWHINGAQVNFVSPAGDRSTGLYAPGLVPVGRSIRIKRWNPGPAGDGFRMDFFHRLVQRG
jgi:hypothetical protein